MRKIILFFLASIAVLSISAFVLTNSIDSTVLNDEYVMQKIGEGGLYDAVISSFSGESGEGIDAMDFVEIIGMKPTFIDVQKQIVGEIVTGTTTFLKDSRVDSIEFGLPENLFPGVTLSSETIFNEDVMEKLREIKPFVQSMLLIKNVSILFALGALVLIGIIARDPKSKFKWLGATVFVSGIFSILLVSAAGSFILTSLNSQEIGSGALEVTIFNITKSLFLGFGELARLQSILLLAVGAILIVCSVLVMPRVLLRDKKEKKMIVPALSKRKV